jgi:hypothetical protein
MSEVQTAPIRANQNRVAYYNCSDAKRIIIVPHASELLTQKYYSRLALAVANLNLSRRKIPDWMADCLFRDDVEFHYQNGGVFVVGDEDIDDAFCDPSFRWLSDLIKSAGKTPKQRPHYTLEFRLRLLALSFWVDRPHVAKHFAR